MAIWYNLAICCIIFDKILKLFVWLLIKNIRFESKVVCGENNESNGYALHKIGWLV